LVAIIVLLTACVQEQPGGEIRLTGSVVEYGRAPSGAPLQGALYLPKGAGPSPVLLYAHGSAPGSLNNEAFEAVAPAFTSRGWAVFAPYRRGQGLSRDAGPFILDEIAAARTPGGPDRAQTQLAHLLAADHMEDQAKAFAWLSGQPFADRRRIAVMGNSFGGIIALLSAEKLAVCGAVDASGAAESWEQAPALQKLMAEAATRTRSPVLFMQAENDFDLAPSRILHAVMAQAGKPAELHLNPPFGKNARDGQHSRTEMSGSG
jgi:carboxymethylenebutenolidase